VSLKPPTSADGFPEVSVLIRAHSRPRGLAAAIGSALAQTYGDLEVVVSDDSGELGPVAAAFDDPRVRYQPNPSPGGPAANLRHAARLARGRLLAILNDDDRWLPGFLASTVEHVHRDAEVAVVFTDEFFELSARLIPRRLPYAQGRHDRFVPQLLDHGIPGSANLMRRVVWEAGERSLPLRDDMVGDLTAWLRAATAGQAFYYVAEPLAVTRLHRAQISWSEQTLPERTLATLDAFRFDDPVSEALRLARVSEFLFARARVKLRRRDFTAARADIARARAAAPGRPGIRELLALAGLRGAVMQWGVAHPRVLAPTLALWRHIRPPVVS
jgi:glycosyltransferase involved in cell wall biosynthesis